MAIGRVAAALALLDCAPSRASPAPLPHRRMRFVASTNGGASSYQPLAELLIAHAPSWNVASAYCSSPGLVTNETQLPSPPFCFENFTLPIRAAAPHVLHFPIIQLLGDSGPLNFRTPYVFAAKYVAWAEAFGFDGFLLDAEFKGDDGAFAAFLDVFADALHAANRSLHVFLYPDMGKAAYVNASRADEFLGTWAGHCSTIPDFLWGLNKCVGRAGERSRARSASAGNAAKRRARSASAAPAPRPPHPPAHLTTLRRYWGRGQMMLYQRDAACTGAGIDAAFAVLNETRASEIGFWANAADLGDSWYAAMARFLAGAPGPRE